MAKIAATCCSTFLLHGWCFYTTILLAACASTNSRVSTWPPSWLTNSSSANWNLLRPDSAASSLLTTLRKQSNSMRNQPVQTATAKQEEDSGTKFRNVLSLLGWPATDSVEPLLSPSALEESRAAGLEEQPRVALVQQQRAGQPSQLSSHWTLLPSNAADTNYYSILVPVEGKEKFSLGRFQNDNRDCPNIETKICTDSWTDCRCYGAYRCNKEVGKCRRLQAALSSSANQAPFDYNDDEAAT